jgi:hypothetical protein
MFQWEQRGLEEEEEEEEYDQIEIRNMKAWKIWSSKRGEYLKDV